MLNNHVYFNSSRISIKVWSSLPLNLHLSIYLERAQTKFMENISTKYLI